MQIIQGTLGTTDEGIIPFPWFPRRHTVTLTFVPGRVQVFLRGFDVANYRGDHHLHRIQVSVEWVTGPTPSSVDVVARGVVGDDGGKYGIRLVVHYTLVVE